MLGKREVDLIIGWLVNKKKMAHGCPEEKQACQEAVLFRLSLKRMTPTSSNVSLVFLLTSAFAGTGRFLSWPRGS